MIIEVTEDDIKAGKPWHTDKCPIALALKRYFPEAEITVTYELIRIDEGAYWPNGRIQDFIYAFDNYKSVKPFSFNLNSLLFLPNVSELDGE